MQKSLPDFLDNVEVSDRSLILYFSEVNITFFLSISLKSTQVFSMFVFFSALFCRFQITVNFALMFSLTGYFTWVLYKRSL